MLATVMTGAVREIANVTGSGLRMEGPYKTLLEASLEEVLKGSEHDEHDNKDEDHEGEGRCRLQYLHRAGVGEGSGSGWHGGNSAWLCCDRYG